MLTCPALPGPSASAASTALLASLPEASGSGPQGVPSLAPTSLLLSLPTRPPSPRPEPPARGRVGGGAGKAEGKLTPRTESCSWRSQARTGVKEDPEAKVLLPGRDLGMPGPGPWKQPRWPRSPSSGTCRGLPLPHVSPRWAAEALQPCGRQPGSRISKGIQAGGLARWKQLRGESGEVGARRGGEGERRALPHLTTEG